MTIQTMNLFEAQIWDGGDRHHGNGVFFNNKQAAEAFKSHFKYETFFERKIVIVDSLESYIEHQHGEERRKALAKLSHRERELLGLVE